MATRKRQNSSMSMSEIQTNVQHRSPFADPNPFDDPQPEPRPSPSPPTSESYLSRTPTLRQGKHKFVSYRLKGDYPKPWMDHPRLKRTMLNNYIVTFFMVLGVLLSALICFMSARTVDRRPVSSLTLLGLWSLTLIVVSGLKYCLVLQDDFKSLDPNIWNHEVQVIILGISTGFR